MSKIFASIALLALLAFGRGVGATEATGWVTYLDQHSDLIVLDGGRSFFVSENINFSSLKDGVKVWVRYYTIDSDRIASEILLAPEAPHNAGTPLLGKVISFCGGEEEQYLKTDFPVSSSAF